MVVLLDWSHTVLNWLDIIWHRVTWPWHIISHLFFPLPAQVSYHCGRVGLHAPPGGHGYHLHYCGNDTVGCRGTWRLIRQLSWPAMCKEKGKQYMPKRNVLHHAINSALVPLCHPLFFLAINVNPLLSSVILCHSGKYRQIRNISQIIYIFNCMIDIMPVLCLCLVQAEPKLNAARWIWFSLFLFHWSCYTLASVEAL